MANHKKGQNKLREENSLLPFFYRKVDDIDTAAVGERLRAIRLKLGMTAKDFGESLQLSYNGIGKMESGSVTPGGRTLILLHEIYGVDIQWLLFGYHTLHSDILNALTVCEEDALFDIFVRLYSHFSSPDRDKICFVPRQKDAAGVTHFAKWDQTIYRPLEEGEICDDEVRFENSGNGNSLNVQGLEEFLSSLTALDRERFIKLTSKQTDEQD